MIKFYAICAIKLLELLCLIDRQTKDRLKRHRKKRIGVVSTRDTEQWFNAIISFFSLREKHAWKKCTDCHSTMVRSDQMAGLEKREGHIIAKSQNHVIDRLLSCYEVEARNCGIVVLIISAVIYFLLSSTITHYNTIIIYYFIDRCFINSY